MPDADQPQEPPEKLNKPEMGRGGKCRRIAMQIQTCIEYQGSVVDDTV